MLWWPAYLFWAVGPTRISQMLDDYPGMWGLLVVLVGGIALILRLAFPPLRKLSRLEVRHDHVSFVPRSLDRRMEGASIAELAVPPQATEILLCKNSLEGLHNGHSLVVRCGGEPEREIQLKFLRVPDTQYCQIIAAGITSATGLPVRLVTRRRSMDGAVQEAQWVPTKVNSSLILVAGAAPFVAGIVVGLLGLRTQIIVAVGVTCWLGQIVAAIIQARRYRKPTEPSEIVLSVLSSVFTFGAVYGLSVVLTASLVRHP